MINIPLPINTVLQPACEITPIVKRKISVVYTTDMMSSTIAAAVIKGICEQSRFKDISVFYDVKFIELGNLVVSGLKEMSDVYLWLGVSPEYGVAYQQFQNEFKGRQHLDNSEWNLTNNLVDEALLTNLRESEVSPKSILQNEHGIIAHPLDKDAVYIGPIWKAVSLFSEIIPELDLDPSEGSMKKFFMQEIIDLEKLSHSFLLKNTSLIEVSEAWKCMKNSIAFLSGNDVILGDKQADIAGYIADYQKCTAAINSDPRRIKTVLARKGGSNVFPEYQKYDVLETSFQENFWIVRRIAAIAGRHFHNSRATRYGVHYVSSIKDIVAVNVDLHFSTAS